MKNCYGKKKQSWERENSGGENEAYDFELIAQGGLYENVTFKDGPKRVEEVN